MLISFHSRKLEKECNEWKLLVRRHGDRRARLIRSRLDQLQAAASLEDMRHLPQARCHELRQNRAGQLTVDLDHPYRLVFEPAAEEPPRKPDGGLDWKAIDAIRILDVEDTHE